MTNIERAADVLRTARADHITLSPEASARALADAGLLAPDLPDANDDSLPLPTRSWELDAEGRPVVWTAPGCSVMIQRVEPGDLTADRARAFALNVLAAVAYSEGDHR